MHGMDVVTQITATGAGGVGAGEEVRHHESPSVWRHEVRIQEFSGW